MKKVQRPSSVAGPFAELVGPISLRLNKLTIWFSTKAKSMPSENLWQRSLLHNFTINKLNRSIPTVDVLVTRTGAFAVHYQILFQGRPSLNRNLDHSRT